MQESKMERDERVNQEAAKAMPESAQAARTDASVKLKVQIDSQSAVVVKVMHQGQPHPKGFAAEIDHTVGPMTMSGEMIERVKNAAINNARGQAHEFSISEFDEAEVQQKASDPQGGTQAVPPVGATAENPNPSAGANSAPVAPPVQQDVVAE